MKVIFLQDVPRVAKAGDIKDVADGYGRNYLIPRKFAVSASPSATAMSDLQKKIKARQVAVDEANMRELANRIQGKEIVLRAKAGEKGKLFGSVTGADVATELEKHIGIEIDKRKVELAEPIKQLGTYEVEVRLSGDIVPKIKVTVEAEEEKEGAEKAEKKAEEKAEEKAAPEEKPAEAPKAPKAKRKKKAEAETPEAVKPEPEAKPAEAPVKKTRKKKTEAEAKPAEPEAK